MSFASLFDQIAKTVEGFQRSQDLGALLVRGVENFVNTEISSIVTSTKTPQKKEIESSSTELQLGIDPQAHIPVLYGRGMTRGVLVDAELASNELDLYLSYVISEVTGPILSTGTALPDDSSVTYTDSEISLKRIFVNDYEVVFNSDGVTFKHIKDTIGTTDNTWDGKIQFYFYKNGSGATSQSFPPGFESATQQNAYDIVPKWNSLFSYTDLCFCVVKITYDAENDLTAIPDIVFDVENSLKQPGDVLYDYMINTRYGAGIPEAEINV